MSNEPTVVDEVVSAEEVSPNGSGIRKSLRELIIAKDDRTSEPFYVKQWGVTVEIRSMSGTERADIMEKFFDQETREVDMKAMNPAFIVKTCYDPESGEAVFSPGDESWLADKNAGALEDMAAIALRLSGLDAKASERSGKG